MDDNLRYKIVETARKYELDPEIVAAIVFVESSGNLFAIRWEPAFYDKYIKDRMPKDLRGHWPQLATDKTERVARAISWGLMQIMGQTARHYGEYRGEFLAGLVDPELNLEIGCRILARFLTKAKSKGYTGWDAYRRALIYWNGSRQYPDRVFKAIKEGRHRRFLPKGTY